MNILFPLLASSQGISAVIWGLRWTVSVCSVVDFRDKCGYFCCLFYFIYLLFCWLLMMFLPGLLISIIWIYIIMFVVGMGQEEEITWLYLWISYFYILVLKFGAGSSTNKVLLCLIFLIYFHLFDNYIGGGGGWTILGLGIPEFPGSLILHNILLI